MNDLIQESYQDRIKARIERDGGIEFIYPVEFMRLTLTYRGPLHAQSNDESRKEEKQAIRHKFHEQLVDLWETHPVLEGILSKWRELDDAAQLEKKDFISAFDIGPFRFVPLVTKHLSLSCELDILFLRKEPPGYIIDGETGDIDNRIKVLFDALRMPKPLNKEIPDGDQPQVNERPFLCLLEDDALITGFNIKTDRLLYPPPMSKAEVHLIIEVKVKVVKLGYGNIGMGGD